MFLYHAIFLSTHDADAIALYAYEAAATGEASLVKGEDVVIIKKADADGWTHVRSQSGTGLVPSSYLQHVKITNANNVTMGYCS